MTPAPGPPSMPASYELVGASAVILRIVSADPSSDQLLELTSVVEDLLAPVDHGSASAVGEQGWLIWTVRGLRQAFRHALEIERRLTIALSRLDGTRLRSAQVRWGIWTDQYVLPFDQQGHPAIPGRYRASHLQLRT